MKFALGQCVATHNAVETMQERGINPLHLLLRHHNGDWGEVGAEDKAANDRALIDGTRLLSAYNVNGVRLWVITEADRSATTILLPEDY